MSKFEISKARLAEIIKEEYTSLHEDNALTRTIDRWSEEGKSIPADQTVARMRNEEMEYALKALERAGFRALLNQIIEINMAPTERLFELADLRDAAMEILLDVIPSEASPHQEDVSERLTPDQLEIDEVDLGKQRKIKKESIDSIRELIKQELQR